MSLIEVLVAGALLVLLLGTLASLLVPAFHAWRRTDIQSQAQQQCLIVTSLITREFQSSKPDRVHVQAAGAEDPPGAAVRRDTLLFASSLDESGVAHLDRGGDPIWQKIVYVYHSGGSREVRCRRAPLVPPTTDPLPLNPAAFVPAADDAVVARFVRHLEFEQADPSWPLRVVVEAAVEGRSSRLESAVSSLLVIVPEPSPSP